MHPYQSKSGKESGVTGYKTGKHFITVWFGEEAYTYTWATAGKAVVEHMKTLAELQMGLSTFIARRRPAYEARH